MKLSSKADLTPLPSLEDINKLTELRMIRNNQVHSTAENIDKKRIELGVEIAETLINKLRG